MQVGRAQQVHAAKAMAKPEPRLIESGSGKAAIAPAPDPEKGGWKPPSFSKKPSGPHLTSKSEGDADVILALAASDAAGPQPEEKPDNDGSDSEEGQKADAGPLTEKQRQVVLEKISNRIGALLSDFEEQTEGNDDDGGASANDLLRIKDGISTMAGTLKKKALMRSAFLQSAHMNMTKRKDNIGADGEQHPEGEESDEDEGHGRQKNDDEADPDKLIEAVQRSEKTKKQKLAVVHEQAVGMLKEAARALSANLEETAAVGQARAAQLEVELSFAKEEAKAMAEERDNSKALTRKAESELLAVSDRLARQSSALETARQEMDHMAAQISALEAQVVSEQRRNKETSAQIEQQQNVGQAGIDAAELAQMNAEQQEKLDEATGKIEVRARARASACERGGASVHAVLRQHRAAAAAIARPPPLRPPPCAHLPKLGAAYLRLRDFASLSLVGMMTSFVAPVLSGGWRASVAPVED